MRYTEGTIYQCRSGYVFIKKDGHRIPYGRYVLARTLRRPLEENERAYHKDGDRANNDPSNLVAITFSGITYNMKATKILFVPKTGRPTAASRARERELAAA